MAFRCCCFVIVFLLTKLASSTNIPWLIQKPSRLQTSILSTDGVKHDSPCSMASKQHLAFAVPKLI